MNKQTANTLGLSTLFDTSRLRLFRDLVCQMYDDSSPYCSAVWRNRQEPTADIEIQVEDDRQFTFGMRFPIHRVRYFVEGCAFNSAQPGRYVSKQVMVSGFLSRGQINHGRSSTEVYYGNTAIFVGVGTGGGFSTPQPRANTTLLRVASQAYNPQLRESMSMRVTIKTLRKILNKVSRSNRGLFCLASSGETWNVFSEDANDNSNRFNIVPTVRTFGSAGLSYDRLYNTLFRKKEAVKGVFRDIDENTVVTVGVTERNCLMIKLDRSNALNCTEWLLFESDIEAPTPSELPAKLPFKARAATQEVVEEEPLEQPSEAVEEVQVEEPPGVETAILTLTEEETTRLAEWGNAYTRWAETTGLGPSELSTSPTVWFSRYMMEKLRLGESVDELDNQLLSRY